MPKSTDRAPRGTNVVYKAASEALAKLPEENRKAIAKAAWEKLKDSLTTVRAKRPARKAIAKRRAVRRRRITKTSETANQIAA